MMKCYICHKRIWFPFERKITMDDYSSIRMVKPKLHYHRPCYNQTNGARIFGKCKESWWRTTK